MIMTTTQDNSLFNMNSAEGDDSFFDTLPPAVSAALQEQDIQALDLALRQMPRDEAEALARWLVKAGVLVQRSKADLDSEQRSARSSPAYPPAVAAALESGNIDAVYSALSELPPDQADRLFESLQQQGLL